MPRFCYPLTMLASLFLLVGCQGTAVLDDDDVGDDDATGGDDDTGDDDTGDDDDTVPTSNQFALEFDGVDDYVDVGDLPDFDAITDGLTIEAWIKPVDNGSGYANTIISKGLRYTEENSRPFFLGFLAYQEQDQLLFHVDTGGGSDGLYSPEGSIEPDVWTYVVGSFDGAQTRTYIDGELAASMAYEGTIPPTDDPVEIGGRTDHNSYYYVGLMNQLRVWSRPLTDAEIAQQFTEPNEIDTDGLIAYWDMNEGTGTVAEDSSGNGNHGAIVGATWVDITTPPASSTP